MCVCPYVRGWVGPHWTFFAYKSWTNGWILIKIIHRVDINDMLKLTYGQGHKVKGQGQICGFVKNLFRLYILNKWIDINDAYTHDNYW